MTPAPLRRQVRQYSTGYRGRRIGRFNPQVLPIAHKFYRAVAGREKHLTGGHVRFQPLHHVGMGMAELVAFAG